METSPLVADILFHLGPVPISRDVVTTWGIMGLLTAASWLGLRRLELRPGRFQAMLEITVEAIEKQIHEIIQRDPSSYLPLLGTLFIFLVCANLATVVPGMRPPTGHIETPAVLAATVFFSVHFFGLRSRGLSQHFRRYIEPNLLLLPLNILAEFTRTFSLMIRLFGNMMSHEIVIAIVVLLAGLLMPIPFMLLGILIGIIQAYIFTILAAVFIGAAVGSVESK